MAGRISNQTAFTFHERLPAMLILLRFLFVTARLASLLVSLRYSSRVSEEQKESTDSSEHAYDKSRDLRKCGRRRL